MIVAAVLSAGLFHTVTPTPDDQRDVVSLKDRKNLQDNAPPPPTSDPAPSGPTTEYQWQPMCSPGSGSDTTCSLTFACPPDQTMWNLYSRPPGGTWTVVRSECRGAAPGGADTAAPVVTPADVLQAVRRLPLPKASLATQPADRTLVNLDTVFSTTAPALDRTVTLLGQRVHITGTASRYTWRFGDGATTTTTEPGRPYPAMDITHRYDKAGQTVHPRVDVTFTISFAVDGGPTQTLDETITTDGIAATLTTHEAVPVLVD